MVKIIKYDKIIIDHAIYIKVLYDITVPCITVFTYDVLKISNYDTSLPELRRFLEEAFYIKVQ